MESISLIKESNIPITTKTYNLLFQALGEAGKPDLLNEKVQEMNQVLFSLLSTHFPCRKEFLSITKHGMLFVLPT